MKFLRAITLAILGFGVATSVPAANQTSYYLFDGDSSRAVVISNGVVVNTFATFSLGYPVAIRESIWLGGRDDEGASEFGLNGVATGNSSSGGNQFSQLLDGATGSNGKNYGVECCGEVNSVTVADANWGNQAVLFNLRDNRDGAGIAFDKKNSSFYVSSFDTVIDHYDISGTILGSFDLGISLVGLAYEELTDSFWGWQRDAQNLVQFDRSGTVLQSTFVAGVEGNPFGGEMRATEGLATNVPEPGTLALIALGLVAVASSSRRRT